MKKFRSSRNAFWDCDWMRCEDGKWEIGVRNCETTAMNGECWCSCTVSNEFFSHSEGRVYGLRLNALWRWEMRNFGAKVPNYNNDRRMLVLEYLQCSDSNEFFSFFEGRVLGLRLINALGDGNWEIALRNCETTTTIGECWCWICNALFLMKCFRSLRDAFWGCVWSVSALWRWELRNGDACGIGDAQMRVGGMGETEASGVDGLFCETGFGEGAVGLLVGRSQISDLVPFRPNRWECQLCRDGGTHSVIAPLRLVVLIQEGDGTVEYPFVTADPRKGKK